MCDLMGIQACKRNLQIRIAAHTSICLVQSEIVAELMAGCAGIDIDYDSICYFCPLTAREPVDGCK